MDQFVKRELPIGYWLKYTDELLTQQINQIHHAHGISRTDWQVLHMIYQANSVSQTEILETMQRFTDAAGLGKIINNFMQRGWLNQQMASSGDIRMQLSDAGLEMHHLLLERQTAVRKRAMQGISQEEYALVIRVLQTMVSNLQKSVSV